MLAASEAALRESLAGKLELLRRALVPGAAGDSESIAKIAASVGLAGGPGRASCPSPC